MEKTFVMVKPDGVQRALIGEIVSRLERKGLRVVALKIYRIPRDIAERFYAEHKGKQFYEGLINYITSGPAVCMVWEGHEAVSVVRAMMGKTNPAEAQAGTIRGDFALHPGRNVIHGSDSQASAKREINLLFNDYELIDYRRIDAEWLIE
ncbi:MAG: nucleoside-diphosphate kinase [Thermoplasmata archaeon]|nr:nucleoside-diphosphate kinase [Candidatus Sysuiplasma acidicola]MBX8646536.1 nucleoside-diphosphate kinase [Candidatus Sysuiplasma acidicola]MDH2905180.1 nucleoside-diphosphate kinase [Methanomassiliicoccales archaeon]